MAAIIAGDRPGQEGIAPGARIVSVKVAGHDGITTVAQVVAAIDWVIEHRNADGATWSGATRSGNGWS